MNRMIRLFQSKADLALEKYLQHRAKVINQSIAEATVDWTKDALVEGARLQTESKVWQRAAELLRKEELNR